MTKQQYLAWFGQVTRHNSLCKTVQCSRAHNFLCKTVQCSRAHKREVAIEALRTKS
ncbi:hypothetical protein DPMN_012287 [Dreissena polymorpha]|uniref:Uncharacterized protein n=1 Tax=Dreissena polymorpha TaxID=45954 RepID=A0A9D4S2L1_DREPO|nr:hypothetical protein DPMN_012287 [Dreissena polymorpha]